MICYFCGAPGGTVVLPDWGIRAKLCETCAGKLDALLEQATRKPAAPGEPREVATAEEYEAAYTEFSGLARECLSDMMGFPDDDPIVTRFTAALGSMATAETMTRLIKMGKL